MSTDLTPQQRLTLIKHLAGGKPAGVVATIMHLEVNEVTRIASHHGYPDREKLAWAADILAKNLDKDAAQALTEGRSRAEIATAERVGATEPPTSAPASARPSDSGIEGLLHTAGAMKRKGIVSLSARISKDLERLRTMVAEEQSKEAERVAATAAKAAALAEVEQLEAQLAAAKAKLRGDAQVITRHQPKGEFPCRHEGCSKVYDTPQGRSLHERMKCDLREQAAL